MQNYVSHPEMKDKVIILTGAGAGIGAAAALQFAKCGAKVVVNARGESCEKVAAEIKVAGGKALACKGDVSMPEVVDRLFDTTLKHFGGLDVLVNVAGIVPAGDVTQATVEQCDEVMRVNVRSVMLTCQRAINIFRKQGGGVIVNVASVAATKGVRNRALYSASKGAVLALTKAMAMDHVTENIRINAISPGTILSPSLQKRIESAQDVSAEYKVYESRQPIGRLGTPEEIAQAILFLASDCNSFMTGANLIVDGGVTL